MQYLTKPGKVSVKLTGAKIEELQSLVRELVAVETWTVERIGAIQLDTPTGACWCFVDMAIILTPEIATS